jgi:hypothetical protein
VAALTLSGCGFEGVFSLVTSHLKENKRKRADRKEEGVGIGYI